MAQTKLQQKLEGAIKRMSLAKPWDLLDKTCPYDANTYAYPLRKGTMPPVVRLYTPFIEAASMYEATNPYPTFPFRLCEQTGLNTSKTFLEALMPDGTSLVVLCEYRGSKDYKLRASIVETDGTHGPTIAFNDMDATALTCICLALWPDILTIDADQGNGRITGATTDLGKAADDRVATPWNDKFDIPDVAKEAAYTLDAVLSIFKEAMTIDCGDNNSDTPAEIEDSYFQNGLLGGKLITENIGSSAWLPMVVSYTGKAAKRGKANVVTVSAAKDEFSVFSANRNWTASERALIPSFPDDMPVMPEVLRMAKRIVSSRNDLNPVCNIMWRGETGFGKSTGMKQLACILNMPFLTQTCHPAMEAQDLKSMFVPASTPEDGFEETFDCSDLSNMATTAVSLSSPEATYDYAYSYVASLEPEKQKDLIDNDGSFFETALMDQEEAETALFGCAVSCELPDLLAIYNKVRTAFLRRSYEGKIERLQQQMKNASPDAKEGPEFVHVISPYIKAMTKGYIVEIQEASRIRDSGVLVAINEFDRPGSLLPMMNGRMAIRHKDAICVITDNVGYSSCRPIDPSVIRRQSMIIDSYELPKDILIDRVKRNTGVTDSKMLELSYKLWNTVREYCQQNSITEGSTSPVELERFVQAVKYDGEDSISVNLDDCIISKATSSIEDQKDIRTACQTLISTV